MIKRKPLNDDEIDVVFRPGKPKEKLLFERRSIQSIHPVNDTLHIVWVSGEQWIFKFNTIHLIGVQGRACARFRHDRPFLIVVPDDRLKESRNIPVQLFYPLGENDNYTRGFPMTDIQGLDGIPAEMAERYLCSMDVLHPVTGFYDKQIRKDVAIVKALSVLLADHQRLRQQLHYRNIDNGKLIRVVAMRMTTAETCIRVADGKGSKSERIYEAWAAANRKDQNLDKSAWLETEALAELKRIVWGKFLWIRRSEADSYKKSYASIDPKNPRFEKTDRMKVRESLRKQLERAIKEHDKKLKRGKP